MSDPTPPTVDVAYRERYVAFLDILGFSELTRRAHDDPAWRNYLREAIATLKSTLPAQMDSEDFRFVQFSDSIVISADRTALGLFMVINGCRLLSRNMLSRGVLLRGGIAAGHFHHDEQLMFGPALLDAYAFEQQGGPPHISLQPVVESEIRILLGTNISDRLVRQDPWDLSPMLHVLDEFEHYDAIPRAGGEVLDREAIRLAERITENATDMKTPAGIRAKWRWLQDYWNRSISTRGILARAEPTDWETLRVATDAAAQSQLALANAQDKLSAAEAT